MMKVKDEPTVVKRIRRGINNVRNKIPNPAEVASASKSFFFGVSGDKFTSNERFKMDCGKISKSSKNKLSSIFGQADMGFIQMLKEEEKHDKVDNLEEFPVPIDVLYNNPIITEGKLGKGVKITLDFESNKVRRNIDT